MIYTDFTTEDNTNIKIFFLLREEDTCKLSTVLELLRQGKNRIDRFVGAGFFNGLKIEIWNPNHPNCPEELKRYGGLTWMDQKLSKIPVGYIAENHLDYFSNILWHEVFHSYAGYVGFNNRPNDIVRNEMLNKKMVYDHYNASGQLECNLDEMFAEYGRRLYGSDLCMNGPEDDHGNYPHALNVQGFKDLFALYKPILDTIKDKNIRWSQFNYSNTDIGYVGFTFYTENWYFQKDYYHVNRDAVYRLINNQWQPIRRFE